MAGGLGPRNLCIIFVIFTVKSLIQCCFADQTASREGLPCANEESLIVRFEDYRPQSEHLVLLSSVVGIHTKDISWAWEARNSIATQSYPSDFAVISVCKESQDQIQRELESSSLVKGVHRQEIIRPSRKLSTIEEQGTNDAGEHSSFKSKPGLRSRGFDFVEDSVPHMGAGGRVLAQQRLRGSKRVEVSPTKILNAEALWDKGFSGKGVKVAVFDTGLAPDHPHFDNVVERINWTNEESIDDGVGHGTFVAGVIGGADDECPGFAPDAELYIFRVFTSDQVSFTSWFLDAFNYAIFIGIDILNLSIGGPDAGDRPFIEKVWEMTANGITVVSAVGNDGPNWGTLNNPADQFDTVGVGALTAAQDAVAPFQSRGMTSWESEDGYGRAKPDVLAPGQHVLGPMRDGSCRALSGTSVASPVVAGALALLLSSLGPAGGAARRRAGTPAALKQALLEGARPLPGRSVYEQGAGRLDLLRAYAVLQEYEPRASLHPAALDLTPDADAAAGGGCGVLWPHCAQPLYAGAQPRMVNLTLLNGMGVAGRVVGHEWRPEPGSEGALEVRVDYPELLWPYSGYLGVALTVPAARAGWRGVAEGVLELTVAAEGGGGGGGGAQRLRLPVRAPVVPTPPRAARVLWDQFHSVRYPSGYLPRDALGGERDLLDWHQDHPHTNFGALFGALVGQGYYVEVLQADYTCLGEGGLAAYGVLLVMDPEEGFFPEEREVLRRAVAGGLGLLAVGDWYSPGHLGALEFFDDNTRCLWRPVTGGANLPALNAALAPWGAALGGRVWAGEHGRAGGPLGRMAVASGAALAAAPAGAQLLWAGLREELPPDAAAAAGAATAARTEDVPVLMALDTAAAAFREGSAAPAAADGDSDGQGRGGRVVVHGDSSCFEGSPGTRPSCGQLLEAAVAFAAGRVDTVPGAITLGQDWAAEGDAPPAAPAPGTTELFKYSKVLAPGAAAGDSCGWVADRARLVATAADEGGGAVTVADAS